MKLGKNQEEDISISGDMLQIRRVMSMRNEEGSCRWMMMFLRKSMNKFLKIYLNEYSLIIIKIIVPIIYFTVSQSIGNDRTVDSHMLDEYRIQKTLKYNNEYILYYNNI